MLRQCSADMEMIKAYVSTVKANVTGSEAEMATIESYLTTMKEDIADLKRGQVALKEQLTRQPPYTRV
ncbi:hypothetical protein [Virgibacillus dakarensis]|uniref:hypothetical protein n=1 Tax=Virgibacillus dakarensis TaxID=1917889 RepID=UPI00190EDE13|nr:hypothetical protein [Virgibacillus dakarensis]